MEGTNYQRIDRSISMLWANIISIALFFPIFLIPTILFVWIWDVNAITTAFDKFIEQPLVLLLGFLVLIILHELLHGLTWQWLGGVSRGKIEYGFKWKTLTPYAHLKVPIRINPYRWGAAMPGLIFGVLPVIVGLALGNGLIFISGLFMTAVAGGDMVILYLLRKDKNTVLVEDHPNNAGCYVLVNTN